MFSNLRLRSWLPALIALAMIIYGVFTSTVNTRDNLRDSNRVTHSRDVLLSLQDTLRHMLDLETGQRGYIIIGDESYLAPYESAIARLDAEVSQLTDLTRDNASQQLRVGMIKEVVEQRKKSLRESIDARRQKGMEAAIVKIRDGGGQEQTNRLRQLIDEMRAEEIGLLAKRENKLEKSLRRTDLTVAVTGTLAITAGATGVILFILFLIAREREERERVERENAEAADRAKSDFLAMMSHEIRTPMNAILGFGELLHDLVDSPQQKHFASAILSSGNSLLTLINDILDLSKIEAGQLELHPEDVVLETFAENLQILFSFRAEEKGLRYVVRVDPKTPPRLSFDALRLRQIVVNLVGNAIKFCHEGSVTVTLRTEPLDTEDTMTLHVEVADTGIGIPADQVTEVFRPFFQVDSRQSRQFQGTGLGLSISRRLAEALGGTISVESELGKGSIFRVQLPARISRRLEENPADNAEEDAPVDFSLLQPSRILVVDDVPLNRELIRTYLADTLHEILEAEDGEQAVKMCQATRPAVVLMDIHLPAMDGREALAMLRAREETRDIPVIAVTASSLLDGQTDLKSLFDGYADKPLNRANLFHELAKFIPPADSAGKAIETPFQLQSLDPVACSRDWEELCAELDILHLTIWPELVKLVPAQATMNFASQLAELARKHSCPLLAGHASQLMEAAGMMDFAASSRLLKGFPEIIIALRASHD
jgi:signal transduction histidine kinase/ActR/RegA family two-component response regulator